MPTDGKKLHAVPEEDILDEKELAKMLREEEEGYVDVDDDEEEDDDVDEVQKAIFSKRQLASQKKLKG